ncbi:MAG: ATP-binding protein, partial [Bacteroidales bacterium]|nr:ATP-binding protein [Bacteroidales bacterium]
MQTSNSIRIYLDFLREVVKERLKEYFKAGPAFDPGSVPLPENGSDESPLPSFIWNHQLNQSEIIMLITALAPHVDPVFFDDLIQKNIPDQGDFPHFGGIRGRNHRGFLPTVETALFLIAGTDLAKRFEYQTLFTKDHLFSKLNMLVYDDPVPGEPQYSGKLILTQDYVEWFLTGKMPHPKFTIDFPAEYITTELKEEDLVLSPATLKQINDLGNWVKHHDTLMSRWNMSRWFKPGYRVLFHGPPGTGKTLTALILGKSTGRDVFRIDLSMVVSKFIGETEKNLSQLFERAKNKDWILFFDEADALFGKRTHVRDAHDKYANQEVAYLLQRIESHDGLVILASNFKSNIDEAFIRR